MLMKAKAAPLFSTLNVHSDEQKRAKRPGNDADIEQRKDGLALFYVCV